MVDEGEVVGLDAAARLGVDHAMGSGDTWVMILAADLPDVTAEALRAMIARARHGAVVIGPSRDGGTNALILSPRLDFRFAYGPTASRAIAVRRDGWDRRSSCTSRRP